MDVVGLINVGPDDDKMFANDLIFNYDYLDSARAAGAGTVAQFVVAIDADAHSSESRLQSIGCSRTPVMRRHP